MSILWRHKKGKLKQKFASISGKDLKFRLGHENEMLKKLKEKLGKSEKDILGIIIDL